MLVKHKITKFYFALMASAGFIMVGIIFVLLWLTVPSLKIEGARFFDVEYGEEYYEPGFKATFRGQDISEHVIIFSNLKSDELGEYLVEYHLKYNGVDKKVKRTVVVKDARPPELELQGANPDYVCNGQKYNEAGFMAFDNYDGDVSERVTKQESDSEIIYSVVDSSGNETIASRALEPHTNNYPELMLAGSNPVNLVIGTNYSEPGVNAIDICDGDITSNVSVESKVDNSKLGTYKIVYSVTNSNNNTTTIERTVIIKPKPINENGIIYLTFDDGPSNLTPQILDILKSEGVKATFFVICRSDGLNHVIKRAYDEGHTIGLHSCTHNYSQIYASETAFFNDLHIIQDKVASIIGQKSYIFRFPGGSSNTVSRFNPGIMSRLVSSVREKGYTYFDWNVSSGDAGGTASASGVYNNVVKGLSLNRANNVLMHDAGDKTYTVAALRDIIRYGKNNGYSFLPISDSTVAIMHGVNN